MQANIENQLQRNKAKMISHRELLLWYGLLVLLGMVIGVVCWFGLLPLVGMTLTVILFSVLNLALLGLFAYLNRGWLSRMDHYPRTGLFVVSVSFSLITFMVLGASSMGLLIPMLFAAPFVFRSIIAGATYLARIRDLQNLQQSHIKAGKKDQAQLAKYDFWAILIGTLLGMAVMVLSAVGNAISVHHESMLGSELAHSFAAVAGVASFGGFFNRIVARNRMEIEQWAMRGMFVFAALLAVFLCSFSLVPAIAATGLMTATFLGIPASIFLYFFFVPSFIGACVSLTDYVLKTGVYVSSRLGGRESSCSKYLSKGGKEHEYRGAAIGMLIGFVIGAVLFGLMLSQPFASLVVAANLGGKILLCLFMAGAISGAASRIFKTFDEREKLDQADQDEQAKNTSDGSNSSLPDISKSDMSPNTTAESTPAVTPNTTPTLPVRVIDKDVSFSFEQVGNSMVNRLSPIPEDGQQRQAGVNPYADAMLKNRSHSSSSQHSLVFAAGYDDEENGSKKSESKKRSESFYDWMASFFNSQPNPRENLSSTARTEKVFGI